MIVIKVFPFFKEVILFFKFFNVKSYSYIYELLLSCNVYKWLFCFSDFLRGVQKVSEELYTPFHCHQVFLYVLSLELVPAAVHIHFYQSNIRLCGHDHYIAQLCLPSQNRFSRRSWVSTFNFNRLKFNLIFMFKIKLEK